jgi:7,8-dihydropterin-6-yl-methyl-4-(beta-D-ribofuranosyl)aminobenzene 5'-phosphate synthase
MPSEPGQNASDMRVGPLYSLRLISCYTGVHPGFMKRRFGNRLLFALLILLPSVLYPMPPGAEETSSGSAKIHIVFDNVLIDHRLQPAWGFAAIIETPGVNILFDTGRDGTILLSNMQKMLLSPADVDLLFVSHAHRDHTGGLALFMAERPDVMLFLTESTLQSIRHLLHADMRYTPVSAPMEITTNISSTGEMSAGIPEQALIIETAEGLVIVTGCAHPGIALMAAQAKKQSGREIYLLAGGFHLSRTSEKRVHDLISQLKALGVKKVAPSHCTGKRAAELFRDAWGEDFIESGLGAVIPLPPLAGKQ